MWRSTTRCIVAISVFSFHWQRASVVDKVKSNWVGCYVNMTWVYCCMLLLVAQSVTSLQRNLSICELAWIDMCVCVSIQRNPHAFASVPILAYSAVIISTFDNCKLSWSDNVRYLGIYLRSSRTFSCSFSHTKQSMYRAFNAVFGKVGRIASPDVVVQLVKIKCLPILCYGIDVCPVNKIS